MRGRLRFILSEEEMKARMRRYLFSSVKIQCCGASMENVTAVPVRYFSSFERV
jgi:hypothetical protein